MARTVAIGIQDFEQIRKNNCFYVGKTDFMHRYYGKKVIILLDEYDTSMQEDYVNGYWHELVAFTRSLFNSTFKTNQYQERAVLGEHERKQSGGKADPRRR